MAPGTEIESRKILLKDVFERWFRIPEYQRPYVWGREQIHDLLDDLTFAATHKPDAEYFMGSLVFQIRPEDHSSGREFLDNDLLDGQQRLTTLLLLMAVMRDMTDNQEIRDTCQSCIYQKASTFKRIPERMRLVFDIRPKVQEFFETYIKTMDGTRRENGACPFERFAAESRDMSVGSMAAAVHMIHDFLQSEDAMPFDPFLDFMLNKVLMIYVATEDLDDAFRLFTILNDRGIPLRNSDILKSINLGALETDADKDRYARMWEDAEGELGDEFDRFLNHVRTILVKEKARQNLLREFEDKIYHPKEKDKTTGILKPKLLDRGRATFEIVERYLGHYKRLIGGSNHALTGSFEFDNLVRVMLRGLRTTDWVPPLLRYYEKFEGELLVQFLQAVNRKVAGDLIARRTPTDRIEAMNGVIKLVEQSARAADVLASDVYSFEEEGFLLGIGGDVYRRQYDRYLLLMLDYLCASHDHKMHFETLSVEHILPQHPSEDSQWVRDFTDARREEWVDKLGNLVIITRRKNASQGRLDYSDKRERYFAESIDTCPNSLRVLHRYDAWTPEQLQDNHRTVLEKLCSYFRVSMLRIRESEPPARHV